MGHVMQVWTRYSSVALAGVRGEHTQTIHTIPSLSLSLVFISLVYAGMWLCLFSRVLLVLRDEAGETPVFSHTTHPLLLPL